MGSSSIHTSANLRDGRQERSTGYVRHGRRVLLGGSSGYKRNSRKGGTVEYKSSAHPPLQPQLPARGTFIHVVSAHSNALQTHDAK